MKTKPIKKAPTKIKKIDLKDKEVGAKEEKISLSNPEKKFSRLKSNDVTESFFRFLFVLTKGVVELFFMLFFALTMGKIPSIY